MDTRKIHGRTVVPLTHQTYYSHINPSHLRKSLTSPPARTYFEHQSQPLYFRMRILYEASSPSTLLSHTNHFYFRLNIPEMTSTRPPRGAKTVQGSAHVKAAYVVCNVSLSYSTFQPAHHLPHFLALFPYDYIPQMLKSPNQDTTLFQSQFAGSTKQEHYWCLQESFRRQEACRSRIRKTHLPPTMIGGKDRVRDTKRAAHTVGWQQ